MIFQSLKSALAGLYRALVGLWLRLGAYFKMHNTRIYQDKSFRFLGVSVLAITGLVVLLPDNKQSDAVAEVVDIVPETPQYDLTRHDLYLEDKTARAQQKTVKLKYGDSLGPLLQKNGVSPEIAYSATKAFSSAFDPRRLRAGQSFNLFFENDVFTNLTFKPNVEQTIFLTRRDDDSFTTRKTVAEFDTDVVTVKSTIENSLYLDANTLGAPDRVIQQFANIYEYSVDFQRDIQPGDAFEMFFEVSKDKKGNIIKSGDLLYTSFNPRGKSLQYYLFADDKKKENFYDAKGKTAKRKLRATPINGARLSSSFGKRRHPISGYRKMHTGVDFAARRGTPIMAAGSGTVERANRYGGYGNYIRIRHTDGYKTAYAHMKNFARGIRRGSYVRQDQVIGYVGSTGASTGPHLHYEVHLNGRKINPRRLSQLSGKPLKASAMPAFKKRRAEIDAMRAASKVITREAPKDETPELTAELVD